MSWWDKTVATMGQVGNKVVAGTAVGWEKTKEVAGPAWEKTKEGTGVAWEKTKEVSKTGFEKTKEWSKNTADKIQGKEASPYSDNNSPPDNNGPI